MKTLKQLRPLIIEWAKVKGLINIENAQKQRLKLMEEIGETAGAILKKNQAEIKDGFGDIFVVIIILAEQLGEEVKIKNVGGNVHSTDFIFAKIIEFSFEMDFTNAIDWLNDCATLNKVDLEECANIAYNVIKDRTGKMVDGTFIKNS